MRSFRTWGFLPGITPAVTYLLLVNTGIFFFVMLLPPHWMSLLGLTPALFWRGALWQPFTYLFLHGNIFHLLFNMLVLWMFGSTLESTWGTRRFVQYYLFCGVGAGLLNAAITPGSVIAVVGSSGAIYGLLLAFGILFPNQLIYFWGIFPIRAKYFVIGIGVLEFLSAMGTTRSGIAHFAHLGGLFFGLLYLKQGDWRRSLSSWRKGKRRTRHLRTVWDQEREKQKIQEEIDRLLDKAGRGGLDSLTPEDHKRFKDLSRKMSGLERRE